MSLISITATLSCDDCGDRFNIDVDPADGDSAYEAVQEAFNFGLGAIDKDKGGFTSMENECFYCVACTKKRDAEANPRFLMESDMRTPKQVILSALSQYRGDNLERATAAFRGKSPEQMQEQYGQSGRTCQQVIDGYRSHADEVDAAIRYVRDLP